MGVEVSALLCVVAGDDVALHVADAEIEGLPHLGSNAARKAFLNCRLGLSVRDWPIATHLMARVENANGLAALFAHDATRFAACFVVSRDQLSTDRWFEHVRDDGNRGRPKPFGEFGDRRL